MLTTLDKPSNETPDGQFELAPAEASVTLTAERSAYETQIDTARKYPRSITRFLNDAKAIISASPETAEACIYHRPVGGGKVAEGLSVRMAEIVFATYEHLSIGVRLVSKTDREVTYEGIAWDMQRNIRMVTPVTEPTVMKDGRPYSESQRIVVAKACSAKAKRDAIFSVIPRALCQPLVDMSRKIAVGDAQTLPDRVAKAKALFRDKMGVSEARIFSMLGIKGWADVGLDHLEILLGINTALKENDTTLEQAFPQVSTVGAVPGAPMQSQPMAPPPSGQPLPHLSSSNQPHRDATTHVSAPPAEQIAAMAVRDGVTEFQIMHHLRTLKLAKADQVELIQLANSKLQQIAETWAALLPKIKEAPTA